MIMMMKVMMMMINNDGIVDDDDDRDDDYEEILELEDTSHPLITFIAEMIQQHLRPHYK